MPWHGLWSTNVRIDTSDDGSSCDQLPGELAELMQQVELMWDRDVDCLRKRSKIGMLLLDDFLNV